MPKSRKQITIGNILPNNFASLDEFWAFWDTHSSADYDELMEDVDVRIDLRSSKIYCAVEKDLVAPIQNQARRQGVSIETLINLWLQEKVRKMASNK